MKTLIDIANKTKTDKRKGCHDYVTTYAKLFESFRQDTFNILEIGVYKGGSIRMWRDYFPNATIYGIDIRQKVLNKLINLDRIVLDKVDQGDREQLEAYVKKTPQWRVVVDDGSHYSSHQKVSFDVLWDNVEPGGYYIIEDTHIATWKDTPFVDSDETIIDKMQSIVYEISSSTWTRGAKHYYCSYARRVDDTHPPVEVLTKYQHEVEEITFRMGLIIIKKRQRHDLST